MLADVICVQNYVRVLTLSIVFCARLDCCHVYNTVNQALQGEKDKQLRRCMRQEYHVAPTSLWKMQAQPVWHQCWSAMSVLLSATLTPAH